MPQIASLAEVEKSIAELDRARVEVQTTVSDLEREQNRIDAEVEQVRARRNRNEERMNSGQISNPKDLANLEHELAALDRRIGTIEDEELEVMESLELAQGDLDGAAAELEQQVKQRDELIASRDAAWIDIDAELAHVTAERESTAATLPSDLLAMYVRLAPNHGGVAAAALVGSRCQGCRLDINGADLRDLQAADADEVLRCPECDRILVRTASGE